jgi:hypothetical protein
LVGVRLGGIGKRRGICPSCDDVWSIILIILYVMDGRVEGEEGIYMEVEMNIGM